MLIDSNTKVVRITKTEERRLRMLARRNGTTVPAVKDVSTALEAVVAALPDDEVNKMLAFMEKAAASKRNEQPTSVPKTSVDDSTS